MIEIPPRFAGKPPVNPGSRADNRLIAKEWQGAQGLAEDVRYYGKQIHDEAEKRIGHLYPKVEITDEMAKDRPDLKPLVGKQVDVIAWLWARTVKSPNPAFSDIDVPLAASFMLSTKPGREVYVDPVVENGTYRFTVKRGKPKEPTIKGGTKLAGSGSAFFCLMSKTPMPFEYLRSEAKHGRMSNRLMAIVAEGDKDRIFLPPSPEIESIARNAYPIDVPDSELPTKALGFRVQEYGISKWSELFTSRQLVALTTFSDLVSTVSAQAMKDALSAGMADDDIPLTGGGVGARAYSEAIALYLGITSSKAARFSTTLSTWRPDETKLSRAFARSDISMTWDFAETNPFSGTGGDFFGLAEGTAAAILNTPAHPAGFVFAANAATENAQAEIYGVTVSTDPPYYDNIPYADLSDYFYVWLRRTLRSFAPEIFATVAVPKHEELVASPYLHGGRDQAEKFFLEGMARALKNIANKSHPALPVTIYYAFKQSETKDNGVTSTGWETFLEAVIQAGFAISGTWPVRTEGATRMRSMGSNALATSIVLVCRRQSSQAAIATRREFTNALRSELPAALSHLQKSNIAPVDLAQAAIGPGMAVFTRYSQVVDAAGNPLSVREALALINLCLDETLAEQEGDFDPDTRWAISWFEQVGFSDGEYGVAETLSKAKNTSVRGMVEAGILTSSHGKVRLLRSEQLPMQWDPSTDARLTAWESVHYLVRALEEGGEPAAAQIVAKLGSRAESARELAYRLYILCERKKRAAEALSYNALVQSWPEILQLAESNTPQQERLI